jgi:hypothetical protein
VKGENAHMADIYWMPEQEKMKIALGKEKILQNEDCISGHTVVEGNFERSKLSAEEAAFKIMNEWKICRVLSIQMNTYIETQHSGPG